MSPDESLQSESAAARVRERLEKPALDYPFAAPPLPGQTIEITPGVMWMRMPMGGKLDHVNAWAVQDGSPAAPNGWAVVDSGLHTADTVSAWRSLFAAATARAGQANDQPGTLTRVLITHMHPDHIGMAGWLVEKLNCRLWMTQLEYLNCRVLMADTGRAAPPDALPRQEIRAGLKIVYRHFALCTLYFVWMCTSSTARTSSSGTTTQYRPRAIATAAKSARSAACSRHSSA